MVHPGVPSAHGGNAIGVPFRKAGTEPITTRHRSHPRQSLSGFRGYANSQYLA